MTSLFLKTAPHFLGEAVVYDEGGYHKGYHGYSTWGPQRATNHLDQVPSMQDGSESFFFRHGHQGLLTLQLQSPMSFSTTQKDSYQPSRNYYQPIRGGKHKRRGQHEPIREKREEGITSRTMDCPVGIRVKPHDFPSFSHICLF